ncbi:MAG: pilus assembly PilX family protein [Gemmatimonadales bacterium]
MKERSMKRMVRNERGMALAVAIMALVVVGALVAGALYVGTQEQRVGENQRRIGQSFGVAEAALVEEANPANWNNDVYNVMPNYPMDTAKLAWPTWKTAPGGTGKYGGYMVKMNDNLYFMDMTGSDQVSRSGALQDGGARQRLGMILRIRPLTVPMQASLTTQGNVSLGGQAEVDGTDQNPTGWTDCAPPDTNKAGIRTSSSGNVTTSGSATISGEPPVVKDPTVADSTFTKFGELLWNDLTAMATWKIPGGTYKTQPSFVGGACNKADQLNWGDGIDRLSACGNYFPIIHITGSTTLNGVQGQGILLVDGDLNVDGSYEFFGITIIQGDMRTAGGGTSEAHFWGMTMARNADLSEQKLSGKATLNYSKCAINEALQKTGKVAQMRSRGWAHLF